MSMAEIDLYSDFQIPMEHDLVYLQQALVNHICVHQVCNNIQCDKMKKKKHSMRHTCMRGCV